MAALVWDKSGEHFYETGVKNGVLYPYDSSKTGEGEHPYGPGVAWNGLSSVTESPDGAEETAIYADDTKYLSLRSIEEFGGTIEAYTYPEEFAACDGSVSLMKGVVIGQQKRQRFGLCYRTVVGNDTDGDSLGYKLHLIYGCTASPSERAYETVNDSPEAITFSWEFETVPVAVTNHMNTSIVTVDSTKIDAEKMKKLEDALYGTSSAEPYLPLPDEVATLLA